MDNLKKYLQQHQDGLDTEKLGDGVWQRIQNSTAPVLPRRNVVKTMWRYAAAACVLACIAAVFLLVDKKKTGIPELAGNMENAGKKTRTAPARPKDTDTKDIASVQGPARPVPDKTAPERNNHATARQQLKKKKITVRRITVDPARLLVQDVEKNYAQLVNMQLEQLRATPVYAESPSYFSIFKQQLKQVEANEATIKKDIRLHGLNDGLLQQLINTNQQKLNVLKDLQGEINKLNNKTKNPESRADSTRAFYLKI